MKTLTFTLLAAALGLLSGRPAAAQDMTLTNVPMQGPMVHIEVVYHAADNVLHAHPEETIPQLTPLSISQPEARFDAADPWYSLLDPLQAGYAFNRQYGLVMGADTDPLPEGTGVWVRQVSATPGLSAFRYRGTDPKAWEPMFGSGGSSEVLEWNLVMFHPAYACPVGSGPHTAEYEAYLVDLATGSPVAGIEPAPFTLHWTVAGEPAEEPQLAIAQRVVIEWPMNSGTVVLEAADKVPGSPWEQVTDQPMEVNGHRMLLVDPSLAARKFFRLRQADTGTANGGTTP